MQKSEVLVIGCGIAGCLVALELAEKGREVTLIASGDSEWESSSALAQGGIVYRGVGDSEDLLSSDIHQAGAGLSHPAAVAQLVALGERYLQDLLIDKYQVPFERDAGGTLCLTHEAAHAHPRVLYYRDQTGRAIMEGLLKAIRKMPQIHLKIGYTAVDLITLSHHSKKITDIYHSPTCVGAYVMENATQEVEIFFARETVLATGGMGAIFLNTTNPKEARGDGVAMAYRAGARIMNMEYVQFHPTAFCHSSERRFLLSEALRGEGAELLDAEQRPFLERYCDRGALAARDIVARSIYQEMLKSQAPHLWLDISFKPADWVKERFPSIYSHCLSKGFDLTREPIPIVPAAHYACGGIAVDLKGRTSIRQLYAVGEVSCTGLHGANRLASTSLLEGLVWGKLCAEDIAEELQQGGEYFPPIEEWQMSEDPIDKALIQQDWMSIKQTMWNYVGLIRDQNRLTRAVKMLQELKWEIDSFYEKAKLTPELLGLRNGIQTALLVTQGAVRNKRSLGCHFRLN